MDKVYIIVITYNGSEDIGEFLETYKKYTSASAHLVVVDNGSTDGTLETIERDHPAATVLRNTKNRGYAGGARQGMEYALAHGAHYIAVVNQDIRFADRWLEPLVDCLEKNQQCAAVQPRILLYPDTTKINSYGNATHYLGFGYTLGYQKNVQEYPCEDGKELASCSGAAVLFRSSALQRVGLIDEFFFMYYEDADLSWRLRLGGYTLMLSCASTVYHRYEFSRSIQKFYFMERNRLIMMVKNYSARALFLVAPMFIIYEVGMVAYSILATLLHRKDTITLREKLRSYLFFISPRNWKYLITERRKTQRLRTVSDEHIVDIFCDVIGFQDIDNPVLRYIANPMTRVYWAALKRIM
ncbi:MAG: glycosyltransferase family 2 protein [Candidatus Uhrbacteria bacterium]|nr:glycosyltransferase family 2 protein [Candidatus Uhrbacteria bacterium]